MNDLSRNTINFRRVLLSILLVCCISHLSGQNILDQKLDFIIEDLSISEALMILSEASEIDISFDPSLVDNNSMIELHEIDVSVQRILDKCLKNQNVEYVVIDNKIVIRNATFSSYYVSGFIKDEVSGESIAGASVQNLIHDDIVKSNAYGYYSMPIRDASSILLITHPKFASKSIVIAQKTPKLDIKLNSDLKLDSLMVIERFDYLSREMYLSNVGYYRTSFQNNSEPDVLQDFDWRSSSFGFNEGQVPNSYWGGSPQHTGVYVDGVRIYRPRQSFGSFTGMNSRIVKSQSNHQHLIPAKYSGYLSNVQALETKVGSMDQPGIDIGVNNLMGNITIDAPIVMNKANFLFSYRQNIHDNWNQGWIDPSTNKRFDQTKISQNFIDLYTKLNVKIKKKHVLSLWHQQSEEILDYYATYDSSITHGPFDDTVMLTTSDSSIYDYTQQTTALNWQYAANPKMILNATFSYSTLRDARYAETSGFEADTKDPLKTSYRNAQRSVLDQMEGKLSFDYFHNENHYMQFGFQTDFRKFSPGMFIENQLLSTTNTESATFTFNDNLFDENTAIRMFFQDKISLKKINANFGITAGAFGTTDRNYFFAEPRVSFSYKASNTSDYSLNVYTANQFHQSPNFAASNLPFDFLVSTNFQNTPEKSWHAHIGHLRKITRYSTIAIDAYHKEYTDITKWNRLDVMNSSFAYLNSTNFHNFTAKYNNVVNGADVKFASKVGRLRMTSRYGIMQNNLSSESETLPSDFASNILNQQFNFSVHVTITDHLNMGAMWMLNKDSDRNDISYFPNYGSLNFSEYEVSSEPVENSLLYHRMDAFVEYVVKKNNGIHQIYLKAFNAYDQKNIVQVYNGIQTEDTSTNYSIFGQGLTPSIGYQYTWRKRNINASVLD